MDAHLTELYNQEALYLHELMREFTDTHMKIGRRLGMHASHVGDPYVNRLLQSFSFLSARMQARLAAEFPRLTEDLLETAYPNFTAPIPAMAVAKLFPNQNEGDLSAGFVVKRGATFTTRVPEGEKSACLYRSSQDVVLYPLQIESTHLTGVPPDIPSMSRWLNASVEVKGALRLRLRTTNGCRISDLHGIDRLPIYLTGDESVSSHLFELLHVAGVASVTAAPGQFGATGAPLHVVDTGALVHEGMDPEQGLLPLNWPKFHGQNLLLEYFACPSRFYFFTLTGLRDGFRRVHGPEIELVVLLNQPTTELANRVGTDHFSLFCTPVVNLFPLRIDSVEIGDGVTEVPLKPRVSHPWDYEVFSVERVFGHVEADSQRLAFMARNRALQDDEGSHGRYYNVRRERKSGHKVTRRYGTRTLHTATEVHISLTDRDGQPYRRRLDYLSADVWVTNGDLPQLLAVNGHTDLEPIESMPVAQVGLVRPPGVARPPLAQRETAWKLFRQLSLDRSLLRRPQAASSADVLRDILRLFAASDDPDHSRLIDSVLTLRTEAVTRKLPRSADILLGRGVALSLHVDERGFAGVSPYLLGLVLDRYFARQVSVHSFVQTEMHSRQRGLVARWPVQMGTRGVA
jgi:type VI secretion system protein ImpG